jgi:membrane-associated phospholipid phosphatase
LRVAEWITVAYLGYLLALLRFRPVPRRNHVRLLAFASVLGGLVVSAAWWPVSPVFREVRIWLPLLYILLCYWLTGFYFVDPQPEYEASFVAFDRRVRRWLGAEDFARRAPRPLLESLEVAYFGCYVVVPAGMAVLVLAGRSDAADRFCSAVLLAEVVCYAVLPWVRTRPPWVLQPESLLSKRRLLVRRFNLLLVRTVSTQANAFPSGHAAGGLVTALVVAPICPLAGIVFLVIAVGIVAGSVLGEYHYAGDAITGVAVAVAAWSVVMLLGV